MNFPIPPQALRFMGENEREFLDVGDDLLKEITRLSGLNSGASIIDIGSGYGRLAHALLRSGFCGTYHGLEILKLHTDWTQANLSNDRVKFSHLDIKNTRYNPNGVVNATDVKLHEYVVRCDLIVLTSVFTHMYEAEIENYFTCFPNMLRPGGRVVCTFFLINAERRRAIVEEKSELSLPFTLSPIARYHSATDPLHAIAYEEDWVELLAKRSGFAVNSVTYGHWCDGHARPEQLYQDFVVLQHA